MKDKHDMKKSINCNFMPVLTSVFLKSTTGLIGVRSLSLICLEVGFSLHSLNVSATFKYASETVG